MRELGKIKFSSETYTDKNMILNITDTKPTVIDKKLTYMWGKDSNRFPLLTLTQGQGSIGETIKIKGSDTQYTFPVMGRLRTIFRCVRAVGSTQDDLIEVEFADNWLIYQHTAISPSGIHFRAQNDGIQTSTGTYRYRLQKMSGNPNEIAPASDFNNGIAWALGISSIPASKSDGNRSNKQGTTNATNQYSYYRFSQDIAGNIDNAVMEFEVDLEGGGTTNLWMPFEQRQWELQRRDMMEDDSWHSVYNRDINGVIHLKDEKTGEYIPKGAGVKDILRASGMYETFSVLQLSRMKRIMNRVLDATNGEAKEWVFHCGKGFAEMFNDAIYVDAKSKNYFMTLGDVNINDSNDGFLSYGAYFNRFKLINGGYLTIKLTDIFDNGLRAKQARANGQIYRGLPITSYQGVLLNYSVDDDGRRNIQFVEEEGSFKQAVYEGMANLPACWGMANSAKIGDKKDIASYEVLGSQGINILKPTSCYWLECNLG
jgi:hypothetical protein